MSPTPSPVAFSLAAPLVQVVRETRRHPGPALVPVLLMLLPLLPIVGGIEVVLRTGGSAALQGLVAGAPPGRPGALILRPDLSGWLELAALGALLTTAVAVVLAAGLVSGATRPTVSLAGGRHMPTTADAIRAALAVWPAVLAVLVVQLLLAGVVAAAIVGLSVGAKEIQFQLPTVVLTLGLGWLLVVLVRLSLWPAIALTESRPPLASLLRSAHLTRGHVTRILGAAIAAFLALAVPAFVLQQLIELVLTLLADAEQITLSPLAIDLWALAPVPVAVLLLSTLWGREAPVLFAAIRDHVPPDEL